MTEGTKTQVSIGELSRETGISIDCLRIWERRYGSPKAERRPSGHRRYPREEITRLKAVAKALAAGYRPGKVANASLDELNNLLGSMAAMSAMPVIPLATAALSERIDLGASGERPY